MLEKTKRPPTSLYTITHFLHKPFNVIFSFSQPPRSASTSEKNKPLNVQNWMNGLKFIRGKKLLKDLCTWDIGGPFLGEERIRTTQSWKWQCSVEGFTGLEFAAGIPGTVDGATYMNAGANGQSKESFRVQTVARNGLKFGYRLSSFQDMKLEESSKNIGMVVNENIKLTLPDTMIYNLSTSAYKEWLHYWRRTQPLGDQTAGPVSRHPSDIGVAAAELIERAGLKGFVGGAMVSNVHAKYKLCQ